MVADKARQYYFRPHLCKEANTCRPLHILFAFCDIVKVHAKPVWDLVVIFPSYLWTIYFTFRYKLKINSAILQLDFHKLLTWKKA